MSGWARQARESMMCHQRSQLSRKRAPAGQVPARTCHNVRRQVGGHHRTGADLGAVPQHDGAQHAADNGQVGGMGGEQAGQERQRAWQAQRTRASFTHTPSPCPSLPAAFLTSSYPAVPLPCPAPCCIRSPNARPQQHPIADHRVPHALASAAAAQGDVVQHADVVAHYRCLAYHYACSAGPGTWREGRGEQEGAVQEHAATRKHPRGQAGQRRQGSTWSKQLGANRASHSVPYGKSSCLPRACLHPSSLHPLGPHRWHDPS